MPKRRLIMGMAVLLCMVAGCKQQTVKMTYAEALHQARTSIYQAVYEDGSLRQMELNAASGIAVELVEIEVGYWEQLLIERDIPVPDWSRQYEELEHTPLECEGGSMEPLEHHERRYLFLDGIIAAMKQQMQ